MADVFGVRSLIYWWAVLTATVFVKDWLRQLAVLLKSPDMFTPSKIPFSTLPGLNGVIDNVATYVSTAIKFNPNQVLATIGPIGIPGWSLAIIAGLVLLLFGVRTYIHALRSEPWYDDFFALFILYVIIRFEGHIIGSTSLPLLANFKELAVNQALSFFIIIGLLLGLSFSGSGFRSRRAFWRASTAALLVAMFIYPRETANIVGWAVDLLAQLGDALILPANLPFAVLWGAIGMFLALQRLTQESPSGSGGGHGGGKAHEGKAEG
ncbi:MAG: hypothetical protein HZB51_03975 [Chloroflexi bacterium]|nr:hypothetical protein [Chloroflexota bacterium]